MHFSLRFSLLQTIAMITPLFAVPLSLLALISLRLNSNPEWLNIYIVLIPLCIMQIFALIAVISHVRTQQGQGRVFAQIQTLVISSTMVFDICLIQKLDFGVQYSWYTIFTPLWIACVIEVVSVIQTIYTRFLTHFDECLLSLLSSIAITTSIFLFLLARMLEQGDIHINLVMAPWFLFVAGWSVGIYIWVKHTLVVFH
jgi:hypothetical protein